jgi:hypothetical protein
MRVHASRMGAFQTASTWVTRAMRRLHPPGPRWPALSPVASGVERMVHVLDSGIPVPGTRFRLGLDPLLGFVLPVVGDTLAGFVSLSVVFLAVQYRVPPRVIGRMVMNVAVDAAVGSIPIVGDFFDFGWKANERNFSLLTSHRGDLPRRASLDYWLAVAGLLAIGLICIAAPIVLLAWLALRHHHWLTQLHL